VSVIFALPLPGPPVKKIKADEQAITGGVALDIHNKVYYFFYKNYLKGMTGAGVKYFLQFYPVTIGP